MKQLKTKSGGLRVFINGVPDINNMSADEYGNLVRIFESIITEYVSKQQK